MQHEYACPMTPKLFNLVKEWELFEKMFSDNKYVFDDGWFYPSAQQHGSPSVLVY
jgi:hypothetical protein